MSTKMGVKKWDQVNNVRLTLFGPGENKD